MLADRVGTSELVMLVRTPLYSAGKALLRKVGANRHSRAALLRGLRCLINVRSTPQKVKNFLMWPVTTALLGPGHSEKVGLKSGLCMEVGLEDSLQRQLLFYGHRCQYCWEHHTTTLLLRLVERKQTVLIGGAHIGYYATLVGKRLAQWGGTVYAFEPHETFFPRLCHNRELNGLQNLHAERFALYNRSGEHLNFYLYGIRSSLVMGVNEKSRSSTLVETVSIDDYASSRKLACIDLILLDIEGGELKALEGAKHTLAREEASAPDVIFEVIPGQRVQDEDRLYRYLSAFGYQLFLIHDAYAEPFNPGLKDGVVYLTPLGGKVPHAFKTLKNFNILATKRPNTLIHETEEVKLA